MGGGRSLRLPLVLIYSMYVGFFVGSHMRCILKHSSTFLFCASLYRFYWLEAEFLHMFLFHSFRLNEWEGRTLCKVMFFTLV